MATKLEIGGLATLAISVVTGAVWIGELRSDVSSLEKRVSELEHRVDPLRQLKVGKGDLCLKMLEQLGSASNSNRQQQIKQQWDQSGCDGVQANATASDQINFNQAVQNATDTAN